MSRTCTKCPTARMADGTRHLHELPPGSRFRFEGREEVLLLEHISLGRATINKTRTAPRKVRRFTTGEGKEVEFLEGPTSTRRPCAPNAHVVPVGGG